MPRPAKFTEIVVRGVSIDVTPMIPIFTLSFCTITLGTTLG